MVTRDAGRDTAQAPDDVYNFLNGIDTTVTVGSTSSGDPPVINLTFVYGTKIRVTDTKVNWVVQTKFFAVSNYYEIFFIYSGLS